MSNYSKIRQNYNCSEAALASQAVSTEWKLDNRVDAFLTSRNILKKKKKYARSLPADII